MLKNIFFFICVFFFTDLFAQDKLRIASTPNPNIFPLLVALSDDPTLPVEIVPVARSTEVDLKFSKGQVDGLLAMTYTIAEKVTSGKVPDLRLVYVALWKSFDEITYKQDHIRSFSDLRGKGLIVAGPTSGGENGGPDLIFQAALKRSGMTMSDVHVCYLPVMEAGKLLKTHAPLNSNSQCDASLTMPASGISLVEPAATGLVMQMMIPIPWGQSMERSISFESIFTGFSAWPQDQLPHGGLSLLGVVLDNPEKSQMVNRVLTAYKLAAKKISSAKGFSAFLIARTISEGIKKNFQAYNLELPVSVVTVAIDQGDLLFRADATTDMEIDINRFITEVVGSAPPKGFYALH